MAQRALTVIAALSAGGFLAAPSLADWPPGGVALCSGNYIVIVR